MGTQLLSMVLCHMPVSTDTLVSMDTHTLPLSPMLSSLLSSRPMSLPPTSQSQWLSVDTRLRPETMEISLELSMRFPDFSPPQLFSSRKTELEEPLQSVPVLLSHTPLSRGKLMLRLTPLFCMEPMDILTPMEAMLMLDTDMPDMPDMPDTHTPTLPMPDTHTMVKY